MKMVVSAVVLSCLGVFAIAGCGAQADAPAADARDAGDAGDAGSVLISDGGLINVDGGDATAEAGL